MLTGVSFLLSNSATGQQVELPSGTGTITVPDGWTVLQTAELDADSRASDPPLGTYETQLLGLISDLRANNRADQHVVLHRSGSNESQLQMINCYSADQAVTSSELTQEANIDKLSEALANAIGGADLVIKCIDRGVSELFAIKSLRMQFALDDADNNWRMDVLVVPSGDRLQYFESQYLADDPTAIRNIEAVLRTYDGAKEPNASVSNLLIVGLAGAVCGTLTAVLRRRRHAKRQAPPTDGGIDYATLGASDGGAADGH